MYNKNDRTLKQHNSAKGFSIGNFALKGMLGNMFCLKCFVAFVKKIVGDEEIASCPKCKKEIARKKIQLPSWL